MLRFAWTVRLPSYVYASRALRRALVPGVASALLMGPGNSANAAPRGAFFSPYGWYGYFSYPADVRSRRQRVAPRRERAEPNKEVGFGEMPKGPLQIVVSIDHQRVTLFSNGVRVAQGPVSTGVPGHPTPMGVFSVIEKDRYHRSNLYSNAPMPFMQRITWSGVALHEGVLPGYPASHGCIRMSRDFAQKLWPTTQLGARVVIARGELAPVDFEHPKLFVPKPKPEPQVAGNATTTDGRDVAQIAVAPATTPGARDDATPARAATDERGNAERATPSSQPMKAAADVKVAASIAVCRSERPDAEGHGGGRVVAARRCRRSARACGSGRHVSAAAVQFAGDTGGGHAHHRRAAAARGCACGQRWDQAGADDRSGEAERAAPEVSRPAGQTERSGGGIRQPQGEEDFRPAGLRATVRCSGRDRGSQISRSAPTSSLPWK